MPHWLTTLLIVAGAITTLLTCAGVIRKKIVRPLTRAYGELLRLLAQIRDASTGVQRLARDVEALAGAVSQFVVRIWDQVEKNTERLGQLEEMHELVVDLDAAVSRITRHLGVNPDGKPSEDRSKS